MEQAYDGVQARGITQDLISSIPLDLLHSELRRRQDENSKPSCGSHSKKGAYNVPIHVFALFLILIVSTLACSFPIIARRFPELPIPHRFLFLSRHFGTGVLIATAFIHLLPTAFVSMTDPCLPRFWNEIYPPMPGLIAMIAVFVVVTVEMVFATRGAGHSHDSDWNRIPDGSSTEERQNTTRRLPLHTIHPTTTSQEENSIENGHVKESRPRSSNDDNDDDSDLDFNELDTLDPIADESAFLSHPGSHKNHQHDRSSSSSHNHNTSIPTTGASEQNPQKLLLQCLLLEAGILFHSIFIGMAVSVAQGAAFVVLLIAIVFHQTFEGFALGARIAALIPTLFPASSPKPWLMALAYGTTTPIGQALGLLLHRMYDPNSEVGLLMVGITNAISSGLLLFAGLVQLIAEDFLSDESYHVLKGRNRIEACLAVGAGGILMAVVGAFA